MFENFEVKIRYSPLNNDLYVWEFWRENPLRTLFNNVLYIWDSCEILSENPLVLKWKSTVHPF